MTALLTDNLQLLAGAPSGIKKLRELILELAVRGKLLEQKSSDEPASELLKNIAKEKALLIENKTIRKGRQLPDIEQNEMQFKLPIGWEWIRLGQIGDWGAGATPARGNSSYYGGEMPWFKSGELIADFISDSEESVTELALKECSLRRNKPGDVLIAMYGATIGKTAILSVEGTTNQAVCACTPFNGVFNRYLLLTLKALKSNFIGQGAGGAQPNISREKIIATVTGLPPLAEQHRIVAKVDELMVLCDRLEAQQTDAESAHTELVQALLDSLTQASDPTDFATNWQRLIEHFDILFTTESSIDALKQTLLQLAVMGKLVSPAQHTTSDKRPEKKQYNHPGLKYQVPMHWDVKSLDQVSQTIIDCPHSTPKWTESGVVCVRTSQFKAGSLDLSSSKYVSEETYLERIQRLEPKENDILYSREGGILGIACRIPEGARLCLGQRMMLIRPHNDALPEFIEIALNSPVITSIARNMTTGGAAPRVNVSVVKAYPIPLPPLTEQYDIVTKVNQLLALCERLKKRLTQAHQLNEQLSNTLVERSLAKNNQQVLIATDLQAARTLLAAEITHRLHSQRTFGQRKLQKVIYLAEHAAKLAAIQGHYLRDAAGPHDRQLMNQIEGELKNRKWYERTERETVGYTYRPLSQAGQHQQAYKNTWLAPERASIEQVIELMRGWDTDHCEMTVTIYAAWNDFILEGRTVTDESIVDEVMHSWNDTKLRFSKNKWLAILTEMKKHKILIPTGFGKRTKGGMLSLPSLE